MSEPVHDLSRLAIDREAPPRSPRRAMRFNIALAVIAVVLIAAAIWWLQGSRGEIEVAVTRATVTGAGAGVTMYQIEVAEMMAAQATDAIAQRPV